MPSVVCKKRGDLRGLRCSLHHSFQQEFRFQNNHKKRAARGLACLSIFKLIFSSDFSLYLSLVLSLPSCGMRHTPHTFNKFDMCCPPSPSPLPPPFRFRPCNTFGGGGGSKQQAASSKQQAASSSTRHRRTAPNQTPTTPPCSIDESWPHSLLHLHSCAAAPCEHPTP